MRDYIRSWAGEQVSEFLERTAESRVKLKNDSSSSLLKYTDSTTPRVPRTPIPGSTSPLSARLARKYERASPKTDPDSSLFSYKGEMETDWQPEHSSVTVKVGRRGGLTHRDSLVCLAGEHGADENTSTGHNNTPIKGTVEGLAGWWESAEGDGLTSFEGRGGGGVGGEEGGWGTGDSDEHDDQDYDEHALSFNFHDALLDASSGPDGWKGVQVERSYTGPRTGSDNTITAEFCVHMIEHLKAQKRLHHRYVWQIVETALTLLNNEATMIDVNIPDHREITVCGDIHGQYYDLLHIFEINGLPSKFNPYVFNGDFVDRGPFSVEVLLTLLALKCAEPSSVTLIRGNHESQVMNLMYGFHTEMCAKHGSAMAARCENLFCHLPLAACLNGKVLVMHGGLFSNDEVTLDDLRAINRFREPPDEGLMAELLWSDPMPGTGRAPNSRGIGVAFGEDVTANFLERNGLNLLIRSHEVKPEGYEVCHNGMLVTVFSAPNYCDRMGNLGAFIRFRGADMLPQYRSFDCSPHPDVPMYINPALF